ncbi:MAG: hypothetical protein HWE16_13390 [Gammaproteobacteria bacterium]|nr:hypothetical protein [Gammaproteobacteria bacterium]
MLDFLTSNPEWGTVVFGAFTAIAGYWFKSFRSKKKNLRKALFLLIEMWHYLYAISAFHPNMFSKKIIASLKANFPKLELPGDDIAQHEQLLELYLKQYIAPITKDMANKGITPVRNPLTDAINEIASDYPFISYKLNSGISTDDLVQSLNSICGNLDSESIDHNLITEQVSDHIYKDTAKLLEKNILSLSLKIGIESWIKAKYFIRKRKNKLKLDEKSIQEDILPFIKMGLPNEKSENNNQEEAESGN